MQPKSYIYLPFAFIVSPLSQLSILPRPSLFTTPAADGSEPWGKTVQQGNSIAWTRGGGCISS